MRSTIGALIATTALFAHGAPAEGRELSGALEVQGFGQWVAVDVLDGTTGKAQQDAWGGGVSLGYNVLEWLEVEVDYSYLENEFRAPDPTPASRCLLRPCRASTNAFTFFGTFNYPAGDVVRPYARFGVGGYFADDPLSRSKGVLVAGGAGARFFPAPDSGLNIRIGTDVTGFFPSSVDGPYSRVWDRSTMNVRVTLGLGYMVGLGQ